MARCIQRLVVLALACALTAAAGCSDDGALAQEHFNNAMRHIERGDSRTAIIELKSALQREANNPAARLALGRLYLEQGLGVEARKELDRARRLGAQDETLTRDLARAMIIAGDFQAAMELIGRDGAADATWKVLEGDARLGLEDRDGARQAFEQAIELDGTNTDARRGLARIKLLEGDPVAARDQVDKALASNTGEVQTWLLKGELELSLDDPAAAEASFTKALEISQALPPARLGLVRALLAQTKTEDAGPHLRILEKSSSKGPGLYYLLALEARQKQDLKAAQDALREVLRVAPNHAPSQLMMGQIHLLRRELDQAKSMLSSFVGQVPNSAAGRKLLAAALLELGESAQAIKTLAPLEQATPDDAQMLSLLGTAHMKQRDFARGREYLDRASKQAPDTAAIRTQLAISHLASGDTAKAASELEAVIEQNADFERADFLLVLTRLREGNTDAALAAAQRLVAKHPDRAESHNLLGAVHETRKDLDAARAAYQRSLELKPDGRAPALNLARMDMIAQQPDSARARFEALLTQHPNDETALLGLAKLAADAGTPERSLELLERARRENPDAVRPRLVLGDYYLRRGQAAQALAAAEEAARSAPDSPPVMLLLGRAQLASGKPGESESTLSRLAGALPRSPAAQFNLALAQQAADRPEAARASLERTLELQPDHHTARAALGQILVRLGRYDEAMAVADRLQNDLPQAAAADMLRGDVHSVRGDALAAVKSYRAAFERSANSALLLKLYLAEQRAGLGDQARARAMRWLEQNPQDARVRSVVAATAQELGDDEQAARDYERVLETSPNNVIALNNLAWLYFKRGDARALELAKRAYEAMPTRAEIADTYGWLLVKSGSVERGLSLIEKAVEAAPHNGDIRYHHAAALLLAGEVERGRSILEKLLAEQPAFRERAEAKVLLDKIR